MADRLAVEVPPDHTGPIEVDIVHEGAVIATVTLPAPPEGNVEPANADSKPSLETRDQREQEILDIAADLISEKGFAVTSIRDIAGAADISIAALYRHIGSKDELLFRITQAKMQELFDHFESNLSEGGTATERLTSAIEVYLAYISKNHRYINLVYRETKVLTEPARARIYDTERQFMKLWENIIKDGIAAKEFATVDTDLAANLAYFSCTVWALRFWSIGDRSENDVATLLTNLIVRGLARGKDGASSPST